uniref:Shisa family member 2a n=3 Tax=Scleropages formosus TaxID=113540 RepID=A0A8C9RKC5_SCLFO
MPASRAALSLCVLLCAGVALQARAGGARGGEYCHGWADAYNDWHAGFHCPEGFDPTESRFCCGSCTLRYCCTAPEARLDQSACDNDDEYEHEQDGGAVQIPAQVPVYLPFLIVSGTFVTFVLVGSTVAWLCCRCLKPKSMDQQSGPAPAQQSCLLETGSPSSDSTTPSRNSSSSSAGRSVAAGRLQNTCTVGSEGGIGMFGPVGTTYPVAGPQIQQYVGSTRPSPYFQPYLNFSVAPEHSMLMTPAYVDTRSTYGGQQAYPFPQAPVP